MASKQITITINEVLYNAIMETVAATDTKSSRCEGLLMKALTQEKVDLAVRRAKEEMKNQKMSATGYRPTTSGFIDLMLSGECTKSHGSNKLAISYPYDSFDVEIHSNGQLHAWSVPLGKVI